MIVGGHGMTQRERIEGPSKAQAVKMAARRIALLAQAQTALAAGNDDLAFTCGNDDLAFTCGNDDLAFTCDCDALDIECDLRSYGFNADTGKAAK